MDTGFNGTLTLSFSIITSLGLSYRHSGRALLADGSESLFDIYEATADWDGQLRRISIDCAETDPLLGMAMLEGYELRVQVSSGGRVSIYQL